MALVPSLFTPGSLFGPTGDPFTTLHREMNRLFDDVLRGGPAAAGGNMPRTNMLLAPNMDVSETDKEVRIQAELPGVTEKDVDLSVDDNVLTIRAEKRQERKEEREGVHFSERNYGTFQRSLRLPFHVNPDQVQARFENGVLFVTLPKTPQQQRSRRIQIQGAQNQAGAQTNGSNQKPTIEGSPAAEGAAGEGTVGEGTQSAPS